MPEVRIEVQEMIRGSSDIAKNMQRLLSLDAFRGITIAAMVLVNDPGSNDAAYPQLKHSAWNGWTMTDMIFPFFLWIVGVAMVFSFAKRVERGEDKKKLILHAVRRGIIIFLLGYVVNNFPFGFFGGGFPLASARIPGVLQRIAICYVVSTIIYLYTSVRGQIAWAVALLAGYWALVKLVPVPGYGAGVLEPRGNLEWYLDSTLLNGHTFLWAPTPGFDPEGILSTIPAIATALLGIITGQFLRSERTREEKTAWMFVVGNGMLLLGMILDMWLPINKNMWTSSYVIFMGGWALIGLAIFYWLIDVKGYRKWATPFLIFGMNAIALYMFAELFATILWTIPAARSDGTGYTLHEHIFEAWFLPWAGPINASLFFATAFVLLTFLLARVLWKRKWFIKI